MSPSAIRRSPDGIAVIEYRVEEGTEKEGYVLVRSDNLYRDPGKEEPLPGGFLLCDRIETLTYRFFDETGKEYETWDSDGEVEAQKKRVPAGGPDPSEPGQRGRPGTSLSVS